MWTMYDELISGIPENVYVEDVVAGHFWIYVRSSLGVGISVSAVSANRPFTSPTCMIGRPVQEVAERIKSWNLVEASIGLAAINSYYNTPEIARANGVKLLNKNGGEDRLNDPYIAYQNLVAGKKVCGVGHASYLKALMEKNCELTQIGDDSPGSFPWDAAEAILPEQDFVYLPCVSFATKQIVRWMELCRRDAKVIVCGPSLPMTPMLFDYGIYDLAGYILHEEDCARARAIVAAAENEFLFCVGEKVSLRADGLR